MRMKKGLPGHPATSVPAAKKYFNQQAGSRLDIVVGDDGSVQPMQRKVTTDEKGPARAARLMLALGPEQAGAILKELDEREIEAIAREMVHIKKLTPTEKAEVLADFQERVEGEPPVRGGMEQAREILIRSLGEDQARSILGRIKGRSIEKDFQFLEKIDPALLSSTLASEHPQITAVALAHISARIAAYVLKSFSPEYRSEVTLRIARTSRIHPDAVEGVAAVLRKRFEKRQQEIYSETSGIETLATILNHTDRGTEDSILGLLEEQAPELLEEVKNKLYTFEELLHLEIREMRLLLGRLNDDVLLATALRGSGEELRRHFFNGLSQNRAADILDEMQMRGPVSIREINDARSYIVKMARQLEDEGAILIKKEKEEYI